MLTQEDLQVLRELMQEELKPINTRLDSMDERLDRIEEDLAEVRGATNYITEWVERIENEVHSKAM